jgi:type II secretory pathway component PulJ
MARTAIYRPGKIEGYVLLDALFAILLSALVAAAVVPGLRAAARLSAARLERAEALVDARNGNAMERPGELAP